MTLARTLIPDEMRHWLAFGSGVGIEVSGAPGAESLRATLVRVRPGRARILDTFRVEALDRQGNGVWGTEFAALLRKHGFAHVAAVVVLPRRDVTVRQLALPGVPDKDLAAAIEFQMEGLHPYAEAEAVTSWTRVPGTSSVLIAITRRTVIERYSTLFAEAGVKIASFTCSAAVIYPAFRLLGNAVPADGLLTFEPTVNGPVEIYGESPERPVFSAAFDVPVERAVALAAAELRLNVGEPIASLGELLHVDSPLPYAAALSSACPLLCLPLNLLPLGERQLDLRTKWIPSAALAAAVALLAVALSLAPRYETQRYLASLNAEIARVTPAANRSAALDRQITAVRARMALLDELHGHTKLDMDVLAEMTRILAPPAWLNTLEITRTQVTLAGETQQAAPLLQLIDASPLFQGAEFTIAPARANNAAESFRIRTNREPGK
jgi:type IV pilus assembly PilN-like protein